MGGVRVTLTVSCGATVSCDGAQASDEANPAPPHDQALDRQIWQTDAIDVMVRRALAASRSADS